MVAVEKVEARGPVSISDVIRRQARLNGMAARCAAVIAVMQARALYLAM